MNENTVYFADNGRRICIKCAGYTAQATGHDLSGAPIVAATEHDHTEWSATMGEPLTCESGCAA